LLWRQVRKDKSYKQRFWAKGPKEAVDLWKELTKRKKQETKKKKRNGEKDKS